MPAPRHLLRHPATIHTTRPTCTPHIHHPGSINVLATVVAIVLVDRLGRRFLFLEGGLQCSVALGVLALLIGIAFPGDTTTASSM